MLTAERVDIIALLEGLPPFSTCTTEVLTSFVAHDAMRAHCGPGETLCGLQQDHNLYVLISGDALLRVGPDVTISLEPGDYFGQQAHRQHRIAGTVVALTDVEVLVVGPQDLARLELASSASRHPSRLELPVELTVLGTRHRRAFRRSN
ncbi:MAG TPA: cyclic nucleotide-binding domain-containing protein [Acidimicrobiales bacterium]|jgi:CRP-like cAMP-binding protein|nr:cyclic nucleotide-binding domain-containing protein [Acidimicrobiales bacterium]